MRRINKAIALLLILAVGMCFLVIGVKYTTASPVTCQVLGRECQAFSIKQNSPISAPEPGIAPKNQPGVAPKVVFFGSSTTVGVGATRGDRRWTTLLSRYLNWQEINEGLSGSTLTKYPRAQDALWDTPAGVERWRQDVIRHNPDLVVMMYGVNDAYRKIPLGSSPGINTRTFQGDLKTLLAGLRSAIPPQRLLVSTPQPNLATQDRRTSYDLALQEGVREVGANFIDAGREAFPSSDLSAYAADGLHLNNLGHAALASFMAGKMVDLGLVPPPPAALGGNEISGELVPLKGGALRIDLDNPLKWGEIRAIEAEWVASGQAILAVMRPNGRGDYEVLYRTSLFPVSRGRSRLAVPRWWVLNGDRLAVWTQGDCLGAQEMPPGTAHHLSFSSGDNLASRDLTLDALKPDSHRLAIRTVASGT